MTLLTLLSKERQKCHEAPRSVASAECGSVGAVESAVAHNVIKHWRTVCGSIEAIPTGPGV